MAYSNETFAHRMKVMRAERKFSQKDLAEASGVGIDSIARYEVGDVTPRLDNAYAIANALGCTIDALLESKPQQ